MSRSRWEQPFLKDEIKKSSNYPLIEMSINMELMRKLIISKSKLTDWKSSVAKVVKKEEWKKEMDASKVPGCVQIFCAHGGIVTSLVRCGRPTSSA